MIRFVNEDVVFVSIDLSTFCRAGLRPAPEILLNEWTMDAAGPVLI
jgi:hypothetical protein